MPDVVGVGFSHGRADRVGIGGVIGEIHQPEAVGECLDVTEVVGGLRAEQPLGLGRIPNRVDSEPFGLGLPYICLVGHHHHEVLHVTHGRVLEAGSTIGRRPDFTSDGEGFPIRQVSSPCPELEQRHPQRRLDQQRHRERCATRPLLVLRLFVGRSVGASVEQSQGQQPLSPRPGWH